MDLIGTDSRGNNIYREPNEAGGHRYWTDSIGGGAVIWDTSIASKEELLIALSYEIMDEATARASLAEGSTSPSSVQSTECRGTSPASVDSAESDSSAPANQPPASLSL
jgi:hypothetical protein